MPNRKNVLLVEDNEINMLVLENILQDEYHVIKASNGIEALEIVKTYKDKISIILTDINMPKMDGYTFIKTLKKHDEYRKIPIIVMTQSDSEEEEITALDIGANDFLPKPYRGEVILHRVKNIINLVENVSMVNYIKNDSLTGLYTKEYFYSKAREILNNDEENEYFIICTNIENFKFYNDVFGQKAGDELLKSIALQISNIVPKEALCSRLNTDRFVMLFPLKNKDEVIEKLKHCIDGQHFQNFVLKFGVYTIIDRNIDIKTMCDRAKIACDNIKGKYDVFINEYDDRAREKLLKEMTIIENMEEALKKQQFTFYLQSKIDLKTNKIIGAEALVRWNHPQYGLIPPNDFVTLFEKNGFITFLDTYIWEQVFIFLENEKKNNIPLVPISINISRVDFFKIDLVEFFSSLLKKYDVEAKYVHLEITESAYIENTNKIIGVIKKLREMNFVIEMDDFGSGYSSLNMLSKLDVDVIKLDRKFIQDEIEKEVGANIISFIVSLAHKLNISVVAEGVENYLHMSTLKNMGCDYAQGYYFSMPMNNKAFIKLIMEKANKEEIIQINDNISEKRKIILIDDDEKYDLNFKKYFSENYDVICLKNIESAMKEIKDLGANISVIIINLALESFASEMFLSQIRHDTSIWEIPILALIDKPRSCVCDVNYDYIDDFVCKYHPLNDISKRIKSLTYIMEVKKYCVDLKKEASHDYTTNLLNRRGFKWEIEKIRKQDYPLAVYMFDLDNLKQINDTYGHSNGDKLILSFANVIRNNCQDSDIICRYGGDEFLLVCKNVDNEENVLKKGETICQEYHKNDEKASCSCGVVILDKTQNISALSIDQVDEVLYNVKKNKKGHCEVKSISK